MLSGQPVYQMEDSLNWFYGITLERAITEYTHFKNNPEAYKAMLMNIFCRYPPKGYIQVNDLEGPQVGSRSSFRCFPNYPFVIMT